MSKVRISKDTKIIYVGMYDQSVILIDSKKKLKLLKKKNKLNHMDKWKNYNGAVSVWYSENGSASYALILNSKEPYVIVHECVHLAQEILNHRGIKCGLKNSEVLAYMVDYLFRYTMELLNDK